MNSFSRYNKLSTKGNCFIVPFVPIRKRPTDVYDYYRRTRLDLLSYKYYGDANYGWLILQANPEYGSLEFNIPENTLLRIPYPLDSVLSQYESDIDAYDTLYGLN